MSGPLPTLSLRIECNMTNPPRPKAVGVFDGKKLIGLMSLEELRKCMSELKTLEGKSSS